MTGQRCSRLLRLRLADRSRLSPPAQAQQARGSRLVLLASIAAGMLAVSVVASSASAHADGASGRICGATKCLNLPSRLAVPLSQRNESFSDVPQPKPSPYYRITIKATGEGFINRKIIWVPSAKDAWFLKEYVTPPLSGYWRTPNSALLPRLRSAVAHLRPFPGPPKWSRVLPK